MHRALAIAALVACAALWQPSSASADPDIQISASMSLDPSWDQPSATVFDDLNNSNGGNDLNTNWVESPGANHGQHYAEGIAISAVPGDWVPLPKNVIVQAEQVGTGEGNDYRADETKHVNEAFCVTKGEELAPQAPAFAPGPQVPRTQGPPRAPSATDAALTNGKQSGTDPVNPFNGELLVNETDLEFPGFGVPYRHTRTYRSRVAHDGGGPMGEGGWDHGLNRALVTETGGPCAGVTYTPGDGTTMRFVQTTTLTTPVGANVTAFETLYESPSGVRITLRAKGTDTLVIGNGHAFHVIDAEWKMTTPDGITATFDKRGVMTRIADLNDRGLSLSWVETSTGDGYRVAEVIDSVGRQIAYEYDSEDRLIRVRHAKSGLEARYTYEDGDLESATSSDGRTESYLYDGGHPDEAPEYIPEAQLRASCERLCGPAGSSCEATGICDDFAAAAKPQCEASCATCVLECADSCADYCFSGEGYEACRTNEGTGGEPSCQSGCQAECGARKDAMCDAFWYGKKLDSTDDAPGSSVQALCANCNDQCTDTCGTTCDTLSWCLGLAAAGATFLGPAGQVGGALGAAYCANESGLGATFETIGDWGETAIYALGDAVSCGVATFCGWFGVSCGDANCDWDNMQDAFMDACSNSCFQCCADGDNCAPGSCQKGHSCEGDCYRAFYGLPLDPVVNDFGLEIQCTNSIGGVTGSGGCPEETQVKCSQACQAQCTKPCGDGCQNACIEGCALSCGYATTGPGDTGCYQDCQTLDYVGLCRTGCEDGCVEEGRKGGPPRYGYPRDLNHNLTVIVDGDGVPYLTNTYGTDPTRPDFDAVITQITGGKTLTIAYRDLEGEVRAEVPEPAPGSTLATHTTTQGRFSPVDICPTPCDVPVVFPTGEWVPVAYGLLLVDQAAALGGLGTVGSVSSTATLPPTLLSVTESAGAYRATSVTGAAGLPAGLAFTLTLPSGHPIAFAPRAGGAWALSGNASALASFAGAHKEITIVRDTGAIVRVYPGRPRAMAHVVEGSCGTPFRAERNDAGQLQLDPPKACKGDLILSPLATAVTAADLRGKFASGTPAALAAADTFGGSALVPGRYVVRWIRVPGFSGRYESAIGPQEGSAPGTLTQAAFAAVGSAPLLRAPSPPSTLADGRPLFAFHLPESLRPTSTTTTAPTFLPAWDMGDRFDVPTRDGCFKTGMPGPAQRGPASAGPVPTTASVVTDPYGVVWTFYYDARGNTLRQVNHATGATRSYNYDAVGDLIGIEQPLGDRTCMRYDDGGNLVNAFQFPVPGAIGDSFPIRQRWTYTAKPVRPEKVFDPRDPTKALATYEWDDRGRLLSITDATNTVTSFVPTELGLPGEIHGPDGSIERIDYDESVGLPRVITSDAMGPSPVVHTMEYDDAGRPIEAVDGLGEQLGWTWEAGSLSGTSQTADGVSTSTLYTIVDGQVRVSGHGMRMTDISYDSLGLPRRMRVRAVDGSAETRVSCMSYGPGSRLLEEIRPDGSRVKYGYDGEGRLTSVVAGAWPRTTGDGFDPECVVSTPAPGEFTSGSVSTTTYDLNGRPILVKDAAGDESKLAYDGFGRVAILTDPRGTSHRAGYDAMGQAVWTASYAPNASEVGYHAPVFGEIGLLAAATTTYDDLGRVQRQEVWQFEPNGAAIGTGKAITTYAYQPTLGQLLVTDPTGAQTLQTFDGAGRLVLTQYPTTDVEIITYLDGGRTILREWSAPTSDGVLTERTKLTAWGAPLQVETSETGALQVMGVWTYDADRRPIGTTGTTGQTQGIGYDAFGQPVAVETSIPGQSAELTTLDYDRMGRVLLQTSDAGNGRGAVESAFTYDVLGRVRTASFPGGRSEAFTYKLASSLVEQRTDPRGVKFGYLYTAGQVDAILATPPNDPTGAKKQLLTYTRDGLGRPVSAKHSGAALLSPADDVTTTLSHDSTGNKLKEWDSGLGAALAITHVPDVRGQPKKSVLGSLVVDRTFDPLGRLTGVKLAGETTNAVGFQYDGLGGPIQRQLASGVTTTYGYDALGRLETQTDTKGSTPIASWRWEQGLDGVARLAGLRKNGLAETASVYQVDAAARVVAERAGVTGLAGTAVAPGDSFAASNLAVAAPSSGGNAVKYTYDGRDSWKQRSSIATPALNVAPTVDAKDAYTTFGSLTPTYDADGALLTLGDETYTYDALGNLTSAQKGSTQKRHYEYDAFGRRVVERDGVTGAVTRFGYDGLSRVLRKLPDGSVDVTVDGGLDEHLVRVSGTTRHYYHQDRGRNVYLVTGSTGQPLEWYDYTAFGELGIRAPDGTTRTASAIGNRYGYQGQPFDHALGLVDMRARAYRPAWGRFISPDPIGYAGGSNLYAFVGSAPLTFWDPLGLARLAQATRDAMTTLANIANNMRVGAMFQRELAATLSLDNVLTDAVRNAPGNAWSWAKATPGGAVAGAKGLWHTVTNPGETIAAMLRADAAILGWISDPSLPDLGAVGAAITNYALHHDQREIAGDVGGVTGGALFAIGSGGVAAAGVARASALLRGLGAGAAETVAGTAAATQATTAAAESTAARVLSNADLACVRGCGPAAGTAPASAGVAPAAEAGTVFHRFGTSYETATRLGRQAAAAEQAEIGTLKLKGLHGVSVTPTVPAVPAGAATRAAIEKSGFSVVYSPTAADPLHHTLLLPKPVTKEIADIFNALFGRPQ